MEVVILAGGFGRRLRTVLDNIPKPMAPVRNKPFLEYILIWLSRYNIRKAVLSVGYKYESIVSYFGNEFNKISLEYAIESEPLGTGGGILNALDKISDENFLIVNGDTFFPVDLNALLASHLLMNSNITVALKEMSNFDRYGAVDIDNENNIIQFHEKKYQKEGLINGGIYLLKKSFICELNLPFQFSFEKEVLEKHSKENKIKGMIFREGFLDIGIPEDYQKAAQIL